MENKIERHASEWLAMHPDATPKEAFIAGYSRSADAWVNKER